MGEINSRTGDNLTDEVTWAWKRRKGVPASGTDCLERQAQPLCLSAPPQSRVHEERRSPWAGYSLPTLHSLCFSALPCVLGLTTTDSLTWAPLPYGFR